MIAAYDGEEAIRLAASKDPDLSCWTVCPSIDGFDVCKRVRRDSTVPIIMITAKVKDDKVLGLELGADDYITKPFSVREVLARVKAQLRRVSIQEEKPFNLRS